jgi:hypothetical protein
MELRSGERVGERLERVEEEREERRREERTPQPELPRRPRSRVALFQQHSALANNPTPLRPSRSRRTDNNTSNDEKYQSWRVGKLVINSVGKFSGEGSGVLSELDEYSVAVKSAFRHVGAPSGLFDLIDLSEASANMEFDETLNEDLWSILFDTTEAKSRARQNVMRFKNGMDGRRAWLTIHKTCMALTSAKRTELRQKVNQMYLDPKRHPEEQFNDLMLLISQLEDAKGKAMDDEDVQDIILQFIRRADSHIYDPVVRTLEDFIAKDTFDPILACDELSKAYDNHKAKGRQPNEKTPGHREPREKERAAAINQPHLDSPRKPIKPGKGGRPCIVCESHGMYDQLHTFAQCPRVANARQQKQQQHGGQQQSTTIDKAMKAKEKSAQGKQRNQVVKTSAIRDDDSIPDSDEDPTVAFDYLGAASVKVVKYSAARVLTLPDTKAQKFINACSQDIWLFDSGATKHVCGSEEWFDDIDTKAIHKVKLADNSTTDTGGVGDISTLIEDEEGRHGIFTLKNALHIPGAQNLISIIQLLDSGFEIDFGKLVLRRNGKEFPFERHADGFYWRIRSYTSPKQQKVQARAALTPAPARELTLVPAQGLTPAPTAELTPAPAPVPARDTSNWQLIKSEYSKYAAVYGRDGKFDTDTHTDGLGPGKGNAQDVREVYSLSDPYQRHSFAGKFIYSCPVFTQAAIEEYLKKANEDFSLDPENTAILVILPYLPTATWWHRTRYFRELHRYPANSRIFTCPAAGTYNTEDLEPAGEEGGPGRVFIGGTPWPVTVLYRDKHTCVRIDDPVKLHLRLGHLSAPYLAKVVDKGINTGLDVKKEHLTAHDEICHCESCILAKAKKPGPHRAIPVTQRPDGNFVRVTSDLRGPINPISVDGMRYLIHFTDIKTEWTCMYAIKTKNEAVQRFKEFRAHLRQHGDLPKEMIIHVDNDKVLTLGGMKDYCDKEGILIEPSIPYIAQTNSRAEAVWHHTEKIANAMLLQADLDATFWSFANIHASYIRNRTPHKHIGYSTPFFERFGEHADLSVLRIFGCPAYSWLPKSKRESKIGEAAIETIYIGHVEDSKQYLLYNTVANKAVAAAKPAFVENLDEHSRRLANPNLQAVLPSVELHSLTHPDPEAIGKVSVKEIRILALGAYYDDQNHETVAVVKFRSQSHPAGAWISATKYVKLGPSTYAHLNEFVIYQNRIGNNGNYYPLFAKVQVFDDKVPGIITAVDISRIDHDDTMFTVALDPDKSDYDKKAADVEVSQVTFTDSFNGQLPLCARIAPVDYKEPITYKQAMNYPDAKDWQSAVDSELNSLVEKGVMKFVDKIPPQHKAIQTKFVFKLKKNADGTIDKYKCRLVAKGFLQSAGIDFEETFAPTSQQISLRLILSLSLRYNLDIKHLDVKTAFLNSELQFDIYVQLPEGFVNENGHSLAQLLKSLYGLKQAARDWFLLSDDFIINFDKRFRRSSCEPCLYFIFTDKLIVFLLVHVDDYIFSTNSVKFYRAFVKAFNAKFEVNELGQLSHFLQIRIELEANAILLSQERLINELALQYGVAEANPKYTPMEINLNMAPSDSIDLAVPYRNLLGSLLWISRSTRPDITFSVTYMSHFCASYSSEHFTVLKRILKYLFTTKTKKLMLQRPTKTPSPIISSYCDSDWAHDQNDRKSFSGSIVLVDNNPVIWISKKQKTVATSSCEAEYMAASEATKDLLHVYHLTKEITAVNLPLQLYIDNAGATYMAQNPVNNKRTKHIDIRYHHVRDWVQRKIIEIVKVPTEENISDILTKSLARPRHEYLVNKLLV